MKNYIKLLRPWHYMKNIMIIFPLVFSGRLMEPLPLFYSFAAVIAFSLLCSVVYIVNDCRDAERDKLHPSKRNRPIASGAISKPKAWVFAVILAALSFLMQAALRFPAAAIVWEIDYLAVNLIYTYGGKNIPVLDIVLLGIGYPIRLMYGGAVLNIEVSEWLFLTALFFSFYLALGKRQGEVKNLKKYYDDDGDHDRGMTRPVLKYYSESYLEKHKFLSMGLGIMSYSLWTVTKSRYFTWTVILVLVICMLYNSVTENADADPVEVLLKHRAFLVLLAIYAVFMLVILYCI